MSSETFWGGVLLGLGVVLGLLSTVMTGMTAKERKQMGIVGAVCVVFGTMLTISPELGTYKDEHPLQALLAFVVLVGAFACILARIVFPRADLTETVPDGIEDGTADDGADVNRHEPAGDMGHQEDCAVERAERQDAPENGLIGDPRKMPVQASRETPSDVSPGS